MAQPLEASMTDVHVAADSKGDELAQHHSAVASDGARADKEREAAMLFSTAERKLMEDDEAHAECEQAAKDAGELFEGVGNRDGCADSLRLRVHSMLARAAVLRRALAKQSDVHDVLADASTFAKSRAEAFAQEGYTRGEAVMRLAYAEVNQDYRGKGKREEALKEATVARKLSKAAGDDKLEAHATYCLSFLRHKMNNMKEALELADECIALCRKVGDKRSEAKAWRESAVLSVQLEQFENGVSAAQEALALSKEAGDSQQEALTNLVIADFFVIRNLLSQALPFAQEALRIFKLDPRRKDLTAQAYNLVTHVLQLSGQDREALRYAEECCQVFESGSDKRSYAMASCMLAHVHEKTGNLNEALSGMEDALNVAQATGDSRLEAQMMNKVALVHLAMGNFDEAATVARDAAGFMQGLQSKHEEAMFLNTVAEAAIKRGDWDDLSRTATEQKSLFQQSGDRKREATCLLTLAGCQASNDTDDAMEKIREALEIYQELDDQRGVSGAHRVMCQILKSKGDLESALLAAEDMRSATKLINDRAAEANAIREIAIIQLERDNPGQAVKLANEAQALAKKSGDKMVECMAWILLSRALYAQFVQNAHSDSSMEKGRAKTLKPAQEALSMAKKLNNRALTGDALLQIGTVHMWTGRVGDAMQAANEARAMFHTEKDVSGEASVVMLIAETQYMAGKEDKAVERCEEVMAMVDPIVNEKLTSRAQQLIDKIKPPMPTMPTGQWVMQAAVPQTEHVPTEPVSAVSAASAESIVQETKTKGLDPAMVSGSVMQLARSITSSEDIQEDAALMDSGLDSLSALSFRQSLQSQMGVKLPSSFVFDYPTVREVTDRIVELSKED